MRTDHVNSTLTLSTTVNTMSIPFFLFFVWLFCYIVLLTIYRNAHRPCRHYSKTFNNSLDYIYSFVPCVFWFSGCVNTSYYIWKCTQTMQTLLQDFQQQSTFHLFSCSLFVFIFWLYFHELLFLEMCTDHVNGTLTLLTTFISYLSWFFLILWLYWS